MTEIAGKTAFVTGGGSGIGKALALALGREAAAVVVADIDGARAEAVAAEIREGGGRALGLACDVSDRASVRRAHAAAKDAFGEVLLLFANAGATSFDPIESVADEIMDWIVAVNLMGVSHCAQVFLPDMLAAGEGHVMGTSSMAGLIPDLVGEHAHYAAAKLGALGLLFSLHREVKDRGVEVTVLCPGGVRTGMANSGSYRPERFGGAFQRTRTAPSYHKVQLFRPPEEVAEMVLQAVRNNRLVVVTDETYRKVFVEQYVDPVLAAFDDVVAFDATRKVSGMDDAFAIQQLINAYHEAGSLADYDRMIATYTPEGIWEFTGSGQRFVGLAAIREAVAGFTGRLEYVAQINAPATIAVDGDTATARSSIRETAKFAGLDEGVEAFGIYRDELVRTAEGWRFARRTFDLRWQHRTAILPAQDG